jgi:hypothetical protein
VSEKQQTNAVADAELVVRELTDRRSDFRVAF